MKVYKTMTPWQRVKRAIKRNLLNIILVAVLVMIFTTWVLTIVEFIDNTKMEQQTEQPVVDVVTYVAPTVNEPIPFYYAVPLTDQFQDCIRELCEEYDVPMSLVIAVMEKESGFQSDVISSTNDYGLMQINQCNHEWLSAELGVTDFLNPYDNVRCGVHMLSLCLDKSNGDVEQALMRYNCGDAGAERKWKSGIYSTNYTQKIIPLYEQYAAESGESVEYS